MNFEIKDRDIILSLMKSSAEYFISINDKQKTIFANIPTDLVERNFKEQLRKINPKYRITDAWCHLMYPGASHARHTHEVDIGVYYLQVPENSGNLILKDSEEIISKENDFVIVPANTPHQITDNKSNDSRIALAFLMAVD